MFQFPNKINGNVSAVWDLKNAKGRYFYIITEFTHFEQITRKNSFLLSHDSHKFELHRDLK